MVDESILREVYNRFQPKIENPVVHVEVVGEQTSQYRYVVTAVGDTGETDGMVVEVVGPRYLSDVAYIRLSWNDVKYAKKYRVYGRTSGVFGLLVETEDTTWVDYGVVVPDTSKVPPVENTTGRLEWESLEFLPGRSLQSAELNEIQAILACHQERLARTLFQDGDVITGCHITVDLERRKVYLTEGKVYIRGRVREIKAGQLDISGSGTEVIGIKVTEKYIDASDDEILLDPAQGYPGYATQGALRKVIVLSWVKDDPDSVPVYELYNGSVLKDYAHARYSELEKTLAVRTKDISGHVVVNGLELVVKEHLQRRDTLVFSVSSGKAYVDGFEVWKSMPVEWEELTAMDTYEISAEVVSPRTSGSYVYELDARPVAKVLSVTGSFFISQTRIVPNSTDEQGWYVDTLPYASIDEVVGLWDSSSKSHQYQLDTDYRVVGNTIRLNPSVFGPGESYYIEYYYFRELVKGKRSLVQASEMKSISGTVYYTTYEDVLNSRRYPLKVELLDSGGNVVRIYREGVDYVVDLQRTETSIGTAKITFGTVPSGGASLRFTYWYWRHDEEGEYVSVDSYLVDDDPYGNYWYDEVIDKDAVDLRTDGTKPDKVNLIVRYQVFLPQRAYLLLDRDGRLSVLRGASALNPVLPVKPVGMLPLYELYIPAFAKASDVVMKRQSRYQVMTVYDMNVLRERHEKLEYDVAMTALEIDALSKDVGAPKKMIFTDSFTDAEKMDYNKSVVGMDTDKGKLLLPMDVTTYVPSVSEASTVRVRSGYALKSYTQATWIFQPIWTEDFVLPLNPFGVFGAFGVVDIYPSSDIWYQKRTIDEIIDSVNLTYVVQWNEDVSVDTVKGWVARVLGVDPNRVLLTSGSGFRFMIQGNEVFVNAVIVWTLRSIVVYFRLFSLPSTEFECWFGGIKVGLSLPSQSELDSLKLGWTVKGSAGSRGLVTAGDGWLTGKFVIPEGVRGGEVPVVFQSVDGRVWCQTSFFGYGKIETYKRQNRLVNVSVERQPPPQERWGGWDPIAQTFVPDRDGFISSVDVWFFAVPATNEILSLKIRKCENGVPTDEVLGVSSKTRDQIASEAGIDLSRRILTVEPSETAGRVRFEFDVPVFVQGGKEYAICLDNSAPGFIVFGAKVGKRILGDLSGRRRKGEILDRQAHDGVVLYSVNARTWESYQDTDLMFRINRAEFNVQEQRLVFQPISGSVGEMIVLVTQQLPSGTNIVWEWSKDGVNWRVFKPTVAVGDLEERWEEEDQKISLGELVSSLYLRGRFITSSEYVSPVVKLDSIRVFGGVYGEEAIYETKDVSLVGYTSFENVKLWFWWLANGGSINEVKVSFDGGGTWYDIPILTSYPVRRSYYEYECGGSVATITGNRLTSASRFKLRLKFSSSLRWISPEVLKLRVVAW